MLRVYIWTLPAGATITAGANTNTITVTFSATGGNITVQGGNACGTGTTSANFPVTINPLPTGAGTITGTAIVCAGQTGVIYSVPAITNATSYTWTLPAGATITAGVNTNSITIAFSFTATSGNITVHGSNACGTGTVSANFSLTVNYPPASAGNITGIAAVCQGQTGVIYSVPAIANATGYIWTLPAGATITAGANTNTITVAFSASAISGNILVSGSSACGNGTVSNYFTVTVCVSSIQSLGATNEAFTIYPNPFNSSLTIMLNDVSQINKTELRIYNILGAELMNTIITKKITTLETNNFTSGVYFYKITSNNKTIQSGRLISQQ